MVKQSFLVLTMENNHCNGEVCQEKKAEDEISQFLHDEVVEALRKEAERRGMTDCRLNLSSGSAKGDNYMSVVVKITVTGNNSEGKEIKWNWIAKVAPQTDLYRSLLKIDVAYAREVFMYKLFNRFDEFQLEKRVVRPFNAHPKYVLSYLEPYKESFVMEDLKSVGFVLRDRKEPLDVNHVKLVMKEYGKLHALSFALRDQRFEEFEVLSKVAEEKIFIPDGQEKHEEVVKHHEVLNAKLLTAMYEDVDADAIESFKLYSKKSVDYAIEAMRTRSQYSVIGHGDCWVNNFLWKYEGHENMKVPTEVSLLDWQLARYGSPVLDISYFIYSCTDQKFREEHYDQMIQLYYYTFCANLVEMGSDPGKLFPFSALEAELRRHSIFGLYVSSMVLQIIVSEASEVPELKNSESSEELVQSFSFESVNDHLYKERVRGVILQGHQKGYFDVCK